MKKNHMAKTIRILAAISVFSALNLCFLGYAGWIAPLCKVQLLPAVLAMDAVAIASVLAVTALMGRIYCSVVCPAGILMDGVIFIRGFFGRRRQLPAMGKLRGVRFAALMFAVVSIALGAASLGAMFDGWSAYGRIVVRFSCFSPMGLSVALASGVVIIGCAWFGGRIFCNTLCPVGAALSLAAMKPLAAIRIDAEKCVKCGLCARGCKSGAIDVKNGKIATEACVVCFDCIGSCDRNAIRYGLKGCAE